MKYHVIRAIVRCRTICFVIALTVFCSAAGLAQQRPTYAPDQLLVGLKKISRAPSTLATEPCVSAILRTIPQISVVRIRVSTGYTLDDAATKLRARPDVAFVEKNFIGHVTAVPNDSNYGVQYAPHRIQADLAWDIWKPQQQAVIAVVDSGIDYNHPDLVNKILMLGSKVDGYNATGTNAVSGIGTDPLDDNGHGTHCAGIAAAQTNNGTGIAGIAGWNGIAGQSDTDHVKLMPVKAMDQNGDGFVSDVADGVTWAANNGAWVINLSLGFNTYSQTLADAVNYAWSQNCVLVAAAGNDGNNVLTFPAAYPHVLSVGSTDNNDTLSSFSDYGSWVDCLAPGEGIYSTRPTYTLPGMDKNYGFDTGTSMSTPHAAGEAALILAESPWLTNDQVYRYILQNVDPFNPISGRTISAGGGRINVFRALRASAISRTVMDFDGDGQADLLVNNPSTGQIAVLLLNGTTVSSSYSLSPSLPAGWFVGGTGDFLNNNTTSIAVQNLSTQQISILGVDGHTISSSTPLTPSMLPNWQIRCAADFNGDGQPDLVAQNTNTREISILTIKNLKITGSIPVHPTLPAGWKVVGARDFDGNGTTDLLVQNTSTQQISILYMSGFTITSSVSVSPNLPAGWAVVGVSDMNFDGTPEVIVQNTTTRQVSMLTISGTRFTSSVPITPTLPAGWSLVGPR